MAIYTRFGNKVKIVRAIMDMFDAGYVTIEYEDGKIRLAPVTMLKADNGFQEIIDEVERLTGQKVTNNKEN